MSRRTPVPKNVRPKTVNYDHKKFIAHTIPLFEQAAENLLRYGLTKEDLHEMVDDL